MFGYTDSYIVIFIQMPMGLRLVYMGCHSNRWQLLSHCTRNSFSMYSRPCTVEWPGMCLFVGSVNVLFD